MDRITDDRRETPLSEADLFARAIAWAAEDPDPRTRAELERLVARRASGELRSRFEAPLTFGTAGIRGELGAGPARMNAALVRRLCAALADEALQAAPTPSPARPRVVVGHDARRQSPQLAREALGVLSGAGVEVLSLGCVPTPLLAFAVMHHRCAAGLMVTASHNPREQNGVKVYWSDGRQIVPPLDERMAARMAAVRSPRDLPFGSSGRQVAAETLTAYLDAVAALPACARPADCHGVNVRACYTPLHGVGGGPLAAAFERTGRPAPQPVAEQARPDPEFPGLPRPNPEEPGVLDLLLARAAADGAALALATDPDADRLAVAIPGTLAGAAGGSPAAWRVLSGDEIGVLLADHVLRTTDAAGRQRGMLVNSIASSTLLAELAAERRVSYRQTLTGFKWIERAAAMGAPGARLLFGYEEALGFGVGEAVRDKDGISAALAFLAAAEACAAEGITIAGRLEQLARRHGLHATAQHTIALDPRAAPPLLVRLREQPPACLAGREVDWSQDLMDPQASPGPSAPLADRSRVGGLPPADVLVFGCGRELRVVVRPSGTEPKLKIYLQCVVEVRGDLREARRGAAQTLARMYAEISGRLTDGARAGWPARSTR